MSRIDDRKPGTPLSEGRPIDPDVIVPDGDAGMTEGEEATQTERIDRKEAGLPNAGLSEDYDEQDVNEPSANPEDVPDGSVQTRGS